MSITYNEVLNRLIEERKHLGLSQMEMAQFVYITQSNYSKVEKGLHRLSFKELKGLSQTDIDLMYIFTGNRCNGKYIDYFQKYTCKELYCYLSIVYSYAVLQNSNANVTHFTEIVNRLKYMPIILGYGKGANIFLIVRQINGLQQDKMAKKLGVDIKKYRKLEKNRCLPDSEIIFKLYEMYKISPAIVLNDKNILINELSSIIEEMETYGMHVMDFLIQK